MNGAYKIYVYAICKNEEQFAARWMRSMSEADGVYVLDTGSEDGTVETLRALGAYVKSERIAPWRFDAARNLSLKMVPEDADLCVCTDLDEVFHPGWRILLEDALTPEVQQLTYRYIWSFLPDGSEGTVFRMEKAHRRFGFAWVNPVHEVLEYHGAAPLIRKYVPDVQLDHHPDPAKPRTQYLPLLELAVKEKPWDDRNMHYLGREYLYRGMWRECEETLLRHLAMPSAQWRDERCASMRYLARAVRALGRDAEAEAWLFRAVAEAPYLREPWLEAAEQEAQNKHWSGSLFFAERALEIRERSQTYINEAESWGAKPYDLAAVAAYYLGDLAKAEYYGRAALALAPEDSRLKSNLVYYTQHRP